MTTRELDAELTKLARFEAARKGRVAVDDKTPMERAVEVRDRDGSYQELERALVKLADLDHAAYRLLDVLYGNPPAVRGNGAREREERAVAWLTEEMRGPVKIPRWAFEEELKRIHVDVLALSTAGHDVSEIAHMLGVSQRRVKQLRARKIAA